MQQNHTDWLRESTPEEIRDGQDASYERFIGKHIAKASIAEYDSTWGDHAWREITTRQSQRRFASQLAEAQTERAA